MIFTYRADVVGITYLSNDNVLPLLFDDKMSLYVVPSVEVAITKLLSLASPLYHAIFTLQIFLLEPKSNEIQEPLP